MLQLALIGVGAWGKNYISTIKSFSDCRIKYLCSKSAKTLQSFQGEYIKTTNYKDLFNYSDIDGIIIATPNSTHYRISHEFIKRGFNLLIEKPLVENYPQSLRLKSLQQNSISRILVGHTHLFDPAYVKTKELAKSIGPIRYISYEGLNNGPYRKNTSTLWDVGPHAISLCLDISKKEPIKISAWALDTLRPKRDFFDLAIIRIKFFDQTEAFIKISWLFPLRKRELVIIGSKSGIIYDADADKRIIYFKNMIPNTKDINLRKNITEVSYPKYDSKTALEVEIREFIDVVKNDNKISHSDLDFGVKVTKMIHLAEESIRHSGREIVVG